MMKTPFVLRGKRLLAAGAAIGLVATSAQAQVSLSLNDTTGDPGAVDVLAGQTFSFSLFLNAPSVSTVGLTYFLESFGAGSSQFSLTQRDTTGSTFSDLITSNALVLQPANALLDPRNNNDLGATVADLNTPNAPGSYFVATFTLAALPSLTNGTYVIQTSANSVAIDGQFNELPLARAAYLVNVVPEPNSGLLLAGLALFGLGVAQRKRRRV